MKVFIFIISFHVATCLPIADNSLFKELENANQGMDTIVQGDIRIRGNNEDRPAGVSNAAIIGDEYRWENGVVPYLIENTFSEAEKETVIKKAMRDIEAVTCIRFQEYSSPPSFPYLNIIDGSGCWSYVGKVFYKPGSKQNLSLRRIDCLADYLAIHELMHALGMWHEQSRADRDNYVIIHYENIHNGSEGNFEKKLGNSFNTPYDPNSIMHYERTAFTKNHRPTITWKDDYSRELGGKVLTASDIYQLNAIYKCPSIPTTKTSTTRSTTTTTTTKKRPTTTSTTTTTTKRPTTTTTTKRPTTTTTTTTTTQRPTTITTTKRPTTTTTTTTTTKRPTTITTTKRPTTTTKTITKRPTTTTTTTTKRPTTTTTTTTTTKRPTTTTTTTKKPTTTTTTTLPSGQACGDLSAVCINLRYKTDNKCHQQYFGERCPRSCGDCTGPKSEICLNLRDKASDCALKAAQGKCTYNSYSYYTYKTKKECARTCCERGELYYWQNRYG